MHWAHQVHGVTRFVLTIGPDNHLYVNIGDGFVSSSAQNPGDLRGKILRMTKTGAIPSDNAFPGTYLHAIGFRNPFGLSFFGWIIVPFQNKTARAKNFGAFYSDWQIAAKLFLQITFGIADADEHRF